MSFLIISFMKNILIIGSGPAGSACAWRLASEGHDCFLADQSEFPRSKICGGVLSHSACSALSGSGMLSHDEIEDLCIVKHRVMTFSADFRRIGTYSDGDPAVVLVNRTSFDSFLRRRAIESGADILHDTFLSLDGKTAVFQSGKKVKFDRIVGADGASSRVRSSLMPNYRPVLSPVLSAVVPMAESAMVSIRKEGMQVFFHKGLFGYGWLFPRGDEVVLGLGSFRGHHGKLGDLMKKLLMHTGQSLSSPVKSALLPSGSQPVTPGGGSCLLVGDAAGLCDRVSGEGITHAIESGFLAAEAIIEGRDYWHANARCTRLVNQSKFCSHLLYSRPFRGLAMKSLGKNDRWFRKYWSIISGTMDYKGLFLPSRYSSQN
jgi:geranylgeranyl reductase family protein